MGSKEKEKDKYEGPDQCLGCCGLGWWYVGPRGETPDDVELPRHTCDYCGGTGKQKKDGENVGKSEEINP